MEQLEDTPKRMTFTDLPDEPLEPGALGKWGDQWQPALRYEEPVPAGTYRGRIREIDEVRKINSGSTLLSLHFEVTDPLTLSFGHPKDYRNKGYGLGWQKIYKHWRKWSMADYLLKSADVSASPNSTEHLERIVEQIRQSRRKITF